uniref:U11-theraphotoxin-Hhn1l n=1 Tax=Cyriopagopus hainanus TaxID=2781057 RepID=H16L1_CYRHA|nr:RecName: Full=U11-theraphotoxin-Hhn1l; Short=U11-TRTX-Hhn1l; AltName: Full=Hainantoxin-XVI-12; Short=HNTX-XVI-12; Flags: Precursor [Haplopelma hainanum]ADB56775.1 HNTX-XVI-12 precursor [Haplopelma hainanum]
MNTGRVTFLVVFLVAVSLGPADKEENPMEMQEKTQQGKNYLNFGENLVVPKLEELKAKLVEKESKKSKNSRQKRCIGEGVACDENDPRCWSGLICPKPTLPGIWDKSYYCYKK